MSGAFNIGGLITGLDTNTIISQLMSIERQPITRLQQQVSTLEQQRTAVRELRTLLLTLRTRAQDFRLNNVFNQFAATSSAESVATAEVSGASPGIGSYTVNVTQLASATVAQGSGLLGSSIDPDTALSASGLTASVSAGTFTVNGVTFTVDPDTQTLNDILVAITSSAAGVNATYDAVADKVVLENKTAGDTSLINLGASGDTSNFLQAINVRQATQATGSNGATVASSTRNLGAIDPSKTLDQTSFRNGPVTAGTFLVNGVSIEVDPTRDSLSDVLQRVTDSDAQVYASYDSATDQIRLVAKNTGSRTVGLTAGTSNFLEAANLTAAVQTPGQDAQFSVNGGPVQTRNSNEAAGAIGDITLRFLSTGTTTVTIAGDDAGIIEDVQAFLTAFNDSIDRIRTLAGAGGVLRGDSGIQDIENTLRALVFSFVSGISGDYKSLVEIGITTGDTFDSQAVAHLQLDEDTFREALRSGRANIKDLFSNTGGTGVADQLFTYLDEVTRTTGFLNDKSKANGGIDQQIQALNDRIDRLEERVTLKEDRLRKQFTRLEQYAAAFQSQGNALTAFSNSLQSL